MRMRRLRRSEQMRALVRETTLDPGDLIYPLFLVPGEGVRKPVGSMPGVFQLSIDEGVREAEEAACLRAKTNRPPERTTTMELSSRDCAHSSSRTRRKSLS